MYEITNHMKLIENSIENLYIIPFYTYFLSCKAKPRLCLRMHVSAGRFLSCCNTMPPEHKRVGAHDRNGNARESATHQA